MLLSVCFLGEENKSFLENNIVHLPEPVGLHTPQMMYNSNIK